MDDRHIRQIQDAIFYVSGKAPYRYVETERGYPWPAGEKHWVEQDASPKVAALIRHHRSRVGFRREDLLRRFPHVLWPTLGNLILSLLAKTREFSYDNRNLRILQQTLENLFNKLEVGFGVPFHSLIRLTLVRLNEEHWFPRSAPGVTQGELDRLEDKFSSGVRHPELYTAKEAKASENGSEKASTSAAIDFTFDELRHSLTGVCKRFSNIFDFLYEAYSRIFSVSEERYEGKIWVWDAYEQEEVYQGIPTAPYIIADPRYSTSNRAFGFDPYQGYHRPNGALRHTPLRTLCRTKSVEALVVQERALTRKFLGMVNQGIGWFYRLEVPESETFFFNPIVSGPDSRIAFCFNDRGLNVDFGTNLLQRDLQLVIDRNEMDILENYSESLEALDDLDRLNRVILQINKALHRTGEISSAEEDLARSRYYMSSMLVLRLRLLIDFKIHNKRSRELPWDSWRPQDRAVFCLNEWYKGKQFGRPTPSVDLDVEEFDYSIPMEEVDLDLDFDQFEW